MKAKQRGVGALGALFWLVVGVILVMMGMKLVPVYMEYFSIKQAIAKIARDAGTPNEARKAFERQADVGYISDVSASDLVIKPGAQGLDISFAYEKRVPLIANWTLLIEFQGSASH